MIFMGAKDRSRDGKEFQQALFVGKSFQDGELRSTKGGKSYGLVSVKAYTRPDGTAAWIDVKSFDECDKAKLSGVRKYDSLLAAGKLETREYNGKTYASIMAETVIVLSEKHGENGAPSASEKPFTEIPEPNGQGDDPELPDALPF
jgi:hypothetical protein